MKIRKKSLRNLFAIQSVLLAAIGFSASASPAKTNAVQNGERATAVAERQKTNVVQTIARKSIFEDDAKNGKDPMFPKSTRRGKSSPSQTPAIAPLEQLSLKGISGADNRRFALINNQPLAAGETALVKIASGQVNVHCWHVSENSAVISIEGGSVKKELSLRDGL